MAGPDPRGTSPPCSSARKGPTRRASDHSRTGNASDACPAPSAPVHGSTRFGDWKSDGSTQLGGFDHPGITFPARSTSRRTPARSSGGWRSAREAWRGVRSARQELRARPASLLGRAGLRARCYPVRPLPVDCARVGLRVSQSSCGAVRYVLDTVERSVGYSIGRRGKVSCPALGCDVGVSLEGCPRSRRRPCAQRVCAGLRVDGATRSLRVCGLRAYPLLA